MHKCKVDPTPAPEIQQAPAEARSHGVPKAAGETFEYPLCDVFERSRAAAPAEASPATKKAAPAAPAVQRPPAQVGAPRPVDDLYYLAMAQTMDPCSTFG